MKKEFETKATGYAATAATAPLGPFTFERRPTGPQDVLIEILYCGICHSDLHIARNEWRFTTYPVVPGHEIIGRVTAVGKGVKRFKTGDRVGVGCMVDSCGRCEDCRDGEEQFCRKDITFTYNSADKKSGGVTYGGYSNRIVVDQKFVLRVSEKLDPAAAAPLLCAGITTYSPLRHWKVRRGKSVGIVGLGGLGHMGVKLAHALGAKVVVFTTSPHKAADARRLGADDVVVTAKNDGLKKYANRLDFIIDTVSAPHNLDPYLALLKRDGTLCLVGVPGHPHPSPNVGQLVFQRRQLAGSLIGGIRETQAMLDFCARHRIVSEIELIPIQKINEAYDRMLKSDVKYRFVIDLASLKPPA